VDVQVLGPPGARDRDGEPLGVTGRQGALLALLALHAPHPVRSDRLVEALWPDVAPADPANALQQRISALRRTLEPDTREHPLVTTPGGYALRLDDEHIDARRFARRAALGAQRLAVGDAAGALVELTGALELWYGEALEGFADEPWAQPDARHLTELRSTVTEDRTDAALASGAGPELVGELHHLVARHPLRERSAGQLMLALYRSGRQAEALATYDRMRRRLADELGVDPGPALQAMYRRVLDQDTALGDGARRPPPSTRVDNLPVASRPLVGRDATLARVDHLLSRARLVTLTGIGGTGKTSVALEVARRRPRPVHGTWLVELARLRDAHAVLGEVAAVLDAGTGGLGGDEPDAARLAASLAERRLLLVLDNCEHVVDAAAELCEHLLAAAPGLTILATSREPLGVEGEHVWPVPPLEVPERGGQDPAVIAATPAVELLLERARQHDPWYDLPPDHADVAAEVVRHLDGLPLAIELAAAQLRVVSLPELAAQLHDRFALLSNARRHVPDRHRTLRGALDWSWDLLEPARRRAWAALAIFADRFDQEGAERVLAAAGVERPVLVVLRELADRSLLVADTRVVPTRYRMLETVRAYGRAQLDAAGVAEPVAAAHAAVVDEALAACHRSTGPATWGVDLDGLGRHLDDARAALTWAATTGHDQLVQRLAGRLGWLWLLRGRAGGGRRWLDRGLGDLASIDAGRVDPVAALWASGLRLATADPDGPRWAALALAAAEDPPDRVTAAIFAALHLAHVGDHERAWATMAEARAAATNLGGWSLGFYHLMSAQLGRLIGRFDEVPGDAAVALELIDAADAGWARAYAIDIAIDVVLHERAHAGAHERARDLAREGLALCDGRQLPELEARLRLQLGRALHELGEADAGRRHVEQALASAARADRGAGYAFALLVAGRLARWRAEHDLAADHLREAVALLGDSGLSFGVVEARAELALTALGAGHLPEAAIHAADALRRAAEVGEPGMLARCLEVRAGTVTGDGALDAAAALLGGAAALRGASPRRADLAEARDADEVVALLRTRLGDALDGRIADAARRASAQVDGTVADLVTRYAAPGDSPATAR
jgi:predicted ATPase/DNA-binding SARP family transcriptional activator